MYMLLEPACSLLMAHPRSHKAVAKQPPYTAIDAVLHQDQVGILQEQQQRQQQQQQQQCVREAGGMCELQLLKRHVLCTVAWHESTTSCSWVSARSQGCCYCCKLVVTWGCRSSKPAAPYQLQGFKVLAAQQLLSVFSICKRLLPTSKRLS
jgi:hypothetical protein